MPTYSNQASGQCLDLLAIAMQVNRTTTNATNPSKMATPTPGSMVLVVSCERPFIFPSFPTRASWVLPGEVKPKNRVGHSANCQIGVSLVLPEIWNFVFRPLSAVPLLSLVPGFARAREIVVASLAPNGTDSTGAPCYHWFLEGGLSP